MIISAEYFVTTNTQFKGNDRDFFIALIEARDAAIRKECADRELEAIGNIAPSKRSDWNLVETAIRAAIEGGKND